MAHFKANLKVSNVKLSRLGSKKTGVTVWAESHKAGIQVYTCYNEKTKENEFVIYETKGSEDSRSIRYIGTLHEHDQGTYFTRD